MPKCKRATQLHSDGTHTYGKISTSGLNAGDAFDCDVNDDGKYDATTERFYYITSLESNSNYAVLLYYNNTVNGVANNTGAVKYSSSDNAYTTGPDTAKTNLPTTSQWKNVSLSNTTRDITNETGTVVKSGFSYAGYAARLLTYQQVKSVCPNASDTEGSLDNCTYLMENTKYQNSSLKYGYWLENVSSGNSRAVYVVWGHHRSIGTWSGNDIAWNVGHGVRPAIEVLKTDIAY